LLLHSQDLESVRVFSTTNKREQSVLRSYGKINFFPCLGTVQYTEGNREYGMRTPFAICFNDTLELNTKSLSDSIQPMNDIICLYLLLIRIISSAYMYYMYDVIYCIRRQHYQPPKTLNSYSSTYKRYSSNWYCAMCQTPASCWAGLPATDRTSEIAAVDQPYPYP
jgi:hypothetical protein